MTRPVELSRSEAEFIVDACEANGAAQWMQLAADLRRKWGMAPYPAGAVKRACEPDAALRAADILAHQSVFSPEHARYWEARGGHDKCTVCNQS